MDYGRLYGGDRENPGPPILVPGMGEGRLREKKGSARDAGGWWRSKTAEGDLRLYKGGAHRDEGFFLFRDGWLYRLEEPAGGGGEAETVPLKLAASPPLSPSADMPGAFTDPQGLEVAVSWSRAMGTSRRGKLKRAHSPSKAASSYYDRSADVWAAGWMAGAALDPDNAPLPKLREIVALMLAAEYLEKEPEFGVGGEDRVRITAETEDLPPAEGKRTAAERVKWLAGENARMQAEGVAEGWDRRRLAAHIRSNPSAAAETQASQRRISSEAAEFGTWCHNVRAAAIAGQNAPPPPVAEWEEEGAAVQAAWDKFLTDYGITILHAEVPMKNSVSGDGKPWVGTADAIGKQGNEFVLVDWKTTGELRRGRVPDSYRCQTAIYSTAELWAPDGHTLEEAPQITRAFIVTASRKGELDVVEMDAAQFGGYLEHANEELRDKARAKARSEELAAAG